MKQSKSLVLRTRIDSRFARELDDYISKQNKARLTNPIDRSHVVREAVMDLIKREPAK